MDHRAERCERLSGDLRGASSASYGADLVGGYNRKRARALGRLAEVIRGMGGMG